MTGFQNHMKHDLLIVDDPTLDDRVAILAPLIEFNLRNASPPNLRPLALLLKDQQGNTTGGLWGRTAYDWLFVELLAVPETSRGQGVGAALIRRAEEIAAERGCIGVWLDTFAFQARGFYEKLGYSVFGQLDDHPKGSARYFLSKRL
jgi:GNAT superfamily N-acetyltransferase